MMKDKTQGKNKTKHQIIMIAVFLFIILIPGFFQIIYNLFGIKLDLKVNGYSSKYTVPTFSVKQWLDEKYQTDLNDWVVHSFVTRGFFIKIYSQLDYDLLGITNGIIVGENDNLFEYAYIDAELSLSEKNDFSLPENKEKLKEYVNDLTEIDNKLKSNGKRLFFYITPSKTHYDREDIPSKYFVIQDSDTKVNGYQYLTSLLKETDISYLDSNELYSDSYEFPPFYSTGSHWSRPFEQVTDEYILNYISENSLEEVNMYLNEELQSSSIPYWRDNDVYYLANVFPKSSKETYYEFNSIIEKKNETKPLHVLMQGGSFSEGLINDYFNVQTDSICRRIMYNQALVDDYREDYKPFNEWSELDLQVLLDEADWVIIEINEQAISNYSDGFVDYLNDYLDTYVPGSLEYVYEEHLIPVEKIGLKDSKGYYDYTDDFCWTQKDCCLNLYNEKISESGIRIDLEIPSFLVDDGETEISVYVNGYLCESNTYDEEGKYSITISEESIKNYTENNYSIEILCDKSLNPSEEEIENGALPLSLKVYYVGENE